MLIFLVGYMVSGKTTLRRELAGILGYPFIDMDELFKKNQGLSIPEYLNRYGEDAFREIERGLLVTMAAMLSREDAVVATGGGTPCFFDNMEVMNNAGVTVYLKVSVDDLYERLKDDADGRPLLRDGISSGLKAFISKHLQEREKFYGKAQIVFYPSIANVDLLVKRLSGI
jgi:shikimate kinase